MATIGLIFRVRVCLDLVGVYSLGSKLVKKKFRGCLSQ